MHDKLIMRYSFKYSSDYCWLVLGFGNLLRGAPRMLLDRSKHIDKSYLARERVSMVDVRVSSWTIPAVHW